MRRVIIIGVILLGLLTDSLRSQTDTLWLRFRPGKKAAEWPGNQIVGELARENGYLLRQFQLGYVFQRTTTCDCDSGIVKLTLIPLHMTGPAEYLGYPLNHLLFPESYRFRAEVKGYAKVLEDKRLNWPDGKSTVLRIPVHACSDTLVFSLSEPGFTLEQVESLKAGIYGIRTYKAIALALKYALDVAQHFDYRDTTCRSCLVATAIELDRVHRILNALSDSIDLPINDVDPDQVREGLLRLGGEVYRRSLFLERMGRLSENDAPDVAVSSAAFIAGWIKSDGFLNPLYNRVFRQLASVEVYESANRGMMAYLARWLPNQGDEWLPKYITALADQLVKLSRNFYEQGLYDPSYLLAYDARTILWTAGFKDEADMLESSLQEPLMALYNVYLAVATDAVSNGNIGLGENYLQKALDFRLKYRAFLPGRISDAGVYQRFADACLEKVKHLKDAEKLGDAIPYLLKAYEYARRLTVYLRQPELDQLRTEVVQKSYLHSLQQAWNAYHSGDYARSAEILDNLMALRKTWSVWLHPLHDEDSLIGLTQAVRLILQMQELSVTLASSPADSLWQQADRMLEQTEKLQLVNEPIFCAAVQDLGRKKFDALMQRAGGFLWDFKLSAAEDALLQADSIARRWYLSDCENINISLENFRKRLARQRTLFADYQYDKYYYRAINAMESGSYASGKNYADTALQWACCGKDTRLIVSLLEKYKIALTYDRALQRLELFYALRQADSMEVMRQQLENLRASDTLVTSLFPPPDTLWLLMLKPRAWLFDSYFKPYLQRGKADIILRWMEKLRSRGAQAEWLESWQKETARALAEADIHIKTSEAAYARLAVIAPDVVWYQVFRANYLHYRLSLFRRLTN
ncbi:MAG: hypothetical protein ACP5O2_11685 [Bacteroidales bacterium]